MNRIRSALLVGTVAVASACVPFLGPPKSDGGDASTMGDGSVANLDSVSADGDARTGAPEAPTADIPIGPPDDGAVAEAAGTDSAVAGDRPMETGQTPGIALGKPCTEPAQCASGNCVGSSNGPGAVCCATACYGICESNMCDDVGQCQHKAARTACGAVKGSNSSEGNDITLICDGKGSCNGPIVDCS
jgi:hypothetical protein